MSTAPAALSAPAPTARSRADHRPELHGLRGLAIALVVLYHVFFDRVSGGVDVFLFLSAFFLTGSFLRRMEDGRPMAPLAYWARTFKRLLPPAAAVILATLAAVYLLLPESTWMPALNDAIASLLQGENWLLIHRGTDYEAAASIATSPLQHFWSLSIQGQVFLAWPLLLALSALLARRLRIPPRRVVLVLFAALALASFAWSVVSTAAAQEVAYFDTSTRVWEFAAGSLLALWPLASPGAPRRAGGRRLRVALGWAGLAVLISTGALIDGRSMFPGWIAAIPLLGATGVFLAGTTGSRFSADRLLSSRPFALLGDISYGLYLVHWPILTITVLVTEREAAGPLLGTAIIAVSLVLAWLLTRLVDSPFRRWRWANARPWRAGAVAVAVLAIGLAPSLGARAQLEHLAEEAARRATVDNPGARALDPAFIAHRDVNPEAPPLPSGATLQQDWAHLELPCEGEFAPVEGMIEGSCRMTEAPEDAPVLVAVGNSRVAQVAMALAGPARENGWRLIILRGPSCVFTPGIASYKGPECDAHNDVSLSYLRDLDPEAVALSTTLLPHEGAERVSRVTEGTVPQLLAEDIDVIALRDAPRVAEDPVACLEAGGTVEECTQALDREAMPAVRADAAVLEELSGRGGGTLHPLDLQPLICPQDACPPIIGNVHVMFDEDHLTATYMESAGQETERLLREDGFAW
ncbi:acyltransferase family protein [Brachybacterium sp. YJGR34]|uniref:acyltransferase family protein n=1 Tax=Brachybacterium sp. YJGR34 TaxID=2059911 RepID=UPI001E3C6855|nr:acyltransferase family protein [Brachybacterium sp. YJGR34]